jgi:hypothetical protein
VLRKYLSPEPLLQDPIYMSVMAGSGRSVPTYAYGANNPIRNTDPTGLFAASGACDNYDEAVRIALKKAGCDSAERGVCSPTIMKRGGCDICPILRDGSGPYLMFKPWVFDTAPSDINKAARVYRYDGSDSRGNRYQFMYLQVRNDACTTGAEWLASFLIHEAMHMCASPAMMMGDPAAAVMNQTCCGSVLPHESGT